MAVKIDIPGIGEVTAENFAQEDTLKELLAAMSKSDRTKRKEEDTRATDEKKLQELKKKESKATKQYTTQTEKLNSQLDDLLEAYDDSIAVIQKWNKSPVWADTKETFKAVGSELMNMAARIITGYDDMAKHPIQGGKMILQTAIDAVAMIAHLGVKIAVAATTAGFGWVPFIGDGVAAIAKAFGELADFAIDVAHAIYTTANEVLAKEYQKRADMLFNLTAVGASFAGGMDQMAQVATQSAIGIENFVNTIKSSRENITAMGYSAADATVLISKGFAALNGVMGKGGRVVRDELLSLGYNFEQQGVIMSQYMAQQRSLGVNLNELTNNAGALAKGTLQYGKHLKVISDITGKDAAQLMDQARAEAQRGALMSEMTGKQAQAFQDAYATLTALPGDQAPKLQAALAQILAGGVVTDPVIAGNRIIMDMLKTTASQISTGNTNMVVATQENLANAAIAYRKAGESATDFATLMNPGGTSAVAQGMSQFGNALRQYRYDPDAAKKSMTAADQQASAAGGLSASYVALQNTMTNFQIFMESLTNELLPSYAAVMQKTSAETMRILSIGIRYVVGKIGLIPAIVELMGASAPGGGANAAKGDTMMPGMGALTASSEGSKAFGEEDTAAGGGEQLASAQSKSTSAPTQGSGEGSLAQEQREIENNDHLGDIDSHTGDMAASGADAAGSARESSQSLKSIDAGIDRLANSYGFAGIGTGTAVPMAADGGVLSGSKDGYGAVLHGTEAVVPLPDGKKIPVNLEGKAVPSREVLPAPVNLEGKAVPSREVLPAAERKSASPSRAETVDVKSYAQALETGSAKTAEAAQSLAEASKSIKDDANKSLEISEKNKATAEASNKPLTVKLDSNALTQAINQQTTILTQILSSMQKNNSLTSGILQNSL